MKNIFLLSVFILLLKNTGAQDIAHTRLSKTSLYNYNAAKPKPDMEYYYAYDAKGQLSGVKYYQDGKLFDQLTDYKYDAAGHLLSYNGKNITNSFPPRSYAFEYDGTGRRTKKTETLYRDGKPSVDLTVYYNYKGDKLTRITERTTFSGNVYDTAIFVVDNEGYEVVKNSAHPNPAMLAGGGTALGDEHDWPLTRYVKEDPKNYLPTFGTTFTTYKYDRNGLLVSSNWKYVHEKDPGQSTGKTLYTYITLKK